MESPWIAIQHGYHNFLANWPLLLIRVAENVAMMVLIILGIIAAVLPFVFYFGAFATMAERIETPDQALELLLQFPWFFLILFLVISFMVIFLTALHSFVQGGVVGCYVDGERQARRSGASTRQSFQVFTPESWYRHARRTWWPIFLIYNITWGVYGLILLIPMALIAVGIWMGQERPEIVGLACGGIVAVFLVAFLGAIVVNLWSTAAIVLSAEGRGVGRSLGEGWRLLIARFLPFVAITVVAFVILMIAFTSIGAASMAVGMVSAIPGVGLLTIPVQVVISLLQTVLSIVIAAWFLAAAVAIVAE